MQETKLLRVKHTIQNPDGSLYKAFVSINDAKRFSREFQLTNGGLGQGSVRVKK